MNSNRNDGGRFLARRRALLKQVGLIGISSCVRGFAFDGGYGITEVALSTDGGKSWQAATLGKDLGRFSFREWSALMKAPRKGTHALLVRAVNRIGQSQPMSALWNPAGYMRNVVETTRIVAA